MRWLWNWTKLICVLYWMLIIFSCRWTEVWQWMDQSLTAHLHKNPSLSLIGLARLQRSKSTNCEEHQLQNGSRFHNSEFNICQVVHYWMAFCFLSDRLSLWREYQGYSDADDVRRSKFSTSETKTPKQQYYLAPHLVSHLHYRHGRIDSRSNLEFAKC